MVYDLGEPRLTEFQVRGPLRMSCPGASAVNETLLSCLLPGPFAQETAQEGRLSSLAGVAIAKQMCRAPYLCILACRCCVRREIVCSASAQQSSGCTHSPPPKPGAPEVFILPPNSPPRCHHLGLVNSNGSEIKEGCSGRPRLASRSADRPWLEEPSKLKDAEIGKIDKSSCASPHSVW